MVWIDVAHPVHERRQRAAGRVACGRCARDGSDRTRRVPSRRCLRLRHHDPRRRSADRSPHPQRSHRRRHRLDRWSTRRPSPCDARVEWALRQLAFGAGRRPHSDARGRGPHGGRDRPKQPRLQRDDRDGTRPECASPHGRLHAGRRVQHRRSGRRFRVGLQHHRHPLDGNGHGGPHRRTERRGFACGWRLDGGGRASRGSLCDGAGALATGRWPLLVPARARGASDRRPRLGHPLRPVLLVRRSRRRCADSDSRSDPDCAPRGDRTRGMARGRRSEREQRHGHRVRCHPRLGFRGGRRRSWHLRPPRGHRPRHGTPRRDRRPCGRSYDRCADVGAPPSPRRLRRLPRPWTVARKAPRRQTLRRAPSSCEALPVRPW